MKNISSSFMEMKGSYGGTVSGWGSQVGLGGLPVSHLGTTDYKKYMETIDVLKPLPRTIHCHVYLQSIGQRGSFGQAQCQERREVHYTFFTERVSEVTQDVQLHPE